MRASVSDLILGCASYVYPAGLAANAEKLAGLTGDIELLVFEGADRSALPARADVRRLYEIAADGDFSYTVHLPLDIDVCSSDPIFRNFSLDRMEEVIELTAALAPRGFVLHLPGGRSPDRWWTETAVASAQKLCAACGKIFVENLTYPFAALEPVFENSDAFLCLDIGHAQKAGDCWKEIFAKFGQRAQAVHFYLPDPASGRHLGLQKAPPGFASEVAEILLSSRYKGVLTLEVFGEEDFFESKKIMEKEIANWAKRQF